MSYQLPEAHEHLINLWGEQNGTLVGGRWDFSFGNGNEHNGAGINDWGYVMPVDYQIIGWSIGMRGTNTADTVIDVTVNGANLNLNLTVPGSQTKAFDQTGVIYTGVAGDTINFRTVAAGGGNDVVVTLQAIGKFIY